MNMCSFHTLKYYYPKELWTELINPTSLMYTLLISLALVICLIDECNSYTETYREEKCLVLKYFSELGVFDGYILIETEKDIYKKIYDTV